MKKYGGSIDFSMKISRKIMIEKRVRRLRKSIKVETQEIRAKTLENLEEIFNLAASLAKGEVKTQTVDGLPVKVTIKQRQMWARVAAYIAQIMNSIALRFDERQIDVELDELERLINEAKAKGKDGEAEQGITQTKGARDPERQN